MGRVLDAWLTGMTWACTVEVIKSNRPASHKLLWSLLVFIFPIGGLLIYWLFSNRESYNSGGYETLP